ncbi:MAG: hypothetical protein HOO67_02275 [Candidatus Peribacteraceae bacterium]|nr:hypothetical protein [Candidatus Peribacteraceae bacterium]
MHISLRHRIRVSVGLFSIITMMGIGRLEAARPTFQTPYVTRAEAAMLLLQARVPTIPPLLSNGEFPDVPRGEWYERYVVVAERLGILQAHPVTNRIRPEDPVTRAEFLSMAARTFGVNVSLFVPSYEDVSAQAWYAPVAGMAQRLNLFPADPDQSVLRPEEYMIHAEVARSVQLLIDASDKTKLKNIAVGSMNDNAKISTNTKSVALIKPRGPATHSAPASSPSLFSYLQKVLSPGADTRQIASLRRDVLALVNAARVGAGLGTLKQHPTLETSAQQYAESMARDDFFGHVSPGGETLKERMEKSGYYKPFFRLECLCVTRFLLGENLARGQKTAKEVVTDWLASPSHREAIMNPDFTDTGIGISAGVWVEHFGGKQK